MKRTFFHLLLAAFMGVITISSCSKKDSQSLPEPGENQQSFSLYLTDAPGYFDHVYVDIQSVKVLVDTTDKKWNWYDDYKKDSASTIEASLQINPGIYDLLKLNNGVDTLLGQGNIPKGKIRLIKIQLGSNNSLIKDSISYPLQTLGNNTIYIKLAGNECQEYAKRKYHLWLDFDVQKSIVKTINGSFYLRPMLKWFIENTSGSIAGRITPRDAYPVISVFNNNGDTSYALPTKEGYFMVRGLSEGSYSVFINSSNGYSDSSINNLAVSKGIKNIGSITLKK